MRTMLISLIFFCSLTQFAIADPPDSPPPTVARKTVEGCGKIYQCYAPEICTNKDAAGKPLTDYAVDEVKEDTEVTEDCPAIIRYFLYNPQWVYVSIESLQPIATITFIEFVHKKKQAKANPGEVYQKITCKFDDARKEMILSFWELIDKIGGELDEKELKEFPKYSEKSEGKPNVICKFNVKNKDENKHIFNPMGNDRIIFNIGAVPSVYPNGVKTKELKASPNKDTRCDPTNLIYKPEKTSRTHKYAKIQSPIYEPGKYYCKDTRYKVQYREDGSTVEPKIADKIDCVENSFKINGEEFDDSKAIDIKCVAEAKFFCKYTAKSPNSQNALKAPVTGPNMNPSKESVMECPPGKPHLTIAGIREPVLNAKFECVNYGGEPVWTVNKEMITNEGPEIYCTEEVDCALIKTIPESSVQNGFLGDTDFLPQCFEGGTMHVEEAGKEMKNVTTKCNGKTGEFKYVVDSGEFVVGPETKFVCTYPPAFNEAKKNEENAQIILAGSLTAAGVGGLTLFLGCVIGCGIVVYRAKKNQKAADRVTNAAYLQYAADKHEKKAKNIEDKKKKNTLANEVGEPEKWNEMLMAHQYLATLRYVAVDGTGITTEKITEEAVAKSDANCAAGIELVKCNKIRKYDWSSHELDFTRKMMRPYRRSMMTPEEKQKEDEEEAMAKKNENKKTQ